MCPDLLGCLMVFSQVRVLKGLDRRDPAGKDGRYVSALPHRARYVCAKKQYVQALVSRESPWYVCGFGPVLRVEDQDFAEQVDG